MVHVGLRRMVWFSSLFLPKKSENCLAPAPCRSPDRIFAPDHCYGDAHNPPRVDLVLKLRDWTFDAWQNNRYAQEASQWMQLRPAGRRLMSICNYLKSRGRPALNRHLLPKGQPSLLDGSNLDPTTETKRVLDVCSMKMRSPDNDLWPIGCLPDSPWMVFFSYFWFKKCIWFSHIDHPWTLSQLQSD